MINATVSSLLMSVSRHEIEWQPPERESHVSLFTSITGDDSHNSACATIFGSASSRTTLILISFDFIFLSMRWLFYWFYFDSIHKSHDFGDSKLILTAGDKFMRVPCCRPTQLVKRDFLNCESSKHQTEYPTRRSVRWNARKHCIERAGSLRWQFIGEYPFQESQFWEQPTKF